jgi:hypothetical protein
VNVSRASPQRTKERPALLLLGSDHTVDEARRFRFRLAKLGQDARRHDVRQLVQIVLVRGGLGRWSCKRLSELTLTLALPFESPTEQIERLWLVAQANTASA